MEGIHNSGPGLTSSSSSSSSSDEETLTVIQGYAGKIKHEKDIGESDDATIVRVGDVCCETQMGGGWV